MRKGIMTEEFLGPVNTPKVVEISEARNPKIRLHTRVFKEEVLGQIREKPLKDGVCIPILGCPSLGRAGTAIKYVSLGRNDDREGEHEFLVIPPKVLTKEQLIKDEPEVTVITVRPDDEMNIVPPGILVISDVKPVFYEKGSEWDYDFQRIVKRFSELEPSLEDY